MLRLVGALLGCCTLGTASFTFFSLGDWGGAALSVRLPLASIPSGSVGCQTSTSHHHLDRAVINRITTIQHPVFTHLTRDRTALLHGWLVAGRTICNQRAGRRPGHGIDRHLDSCAHIRHWHGVISARGLSLLGQNLMPSPHSALLVLLHLHRSPSLAPRAWPHVAEQAKHGYPLRAPSHAISPLITTRSSNMTYHDSRSQPIMIDSFC